MAALGVSAYAVDDWLNEHHRVSIGLSSARHLLAIVSIGTTAGDIRALVRGLEDCVRQLHDGTLVLTLAIRTVPISDLTVDMALSGSEALFGRVEQVPLSEAAGRIAAEIIAPAPPGIPRLVPGQRIVRAHVEWLLANRDMGAFFLDPIDPSERTIRVVTER